MQTFLLSESVIATKRRDLFNFLQVADIHSPLASVWSFCPLMFLTCLARQVAACTELADSSTHIFSCRFSEQGSAATPFIWWDINLDLCPPASCQLSWNYWEMPYQYDFVLFCQFWLMSHQIQKFAMCER